MKKTKKNNLRLYKEKRNELERNLQQWQNNEGYDEKDLPLEKDVKELSYVDENDKKS